MLILLRIDLFIMTEDQNKSRREFLKSGMVVAASATAGCVGPLSRSNENKEPFSHPSVEGIDNQPYLGPEPSRDTPIIVAFEDLACPSCASFHQGAFQELKDQYMDNQQLTFVFRAVDVVYNWGSIAAQVQESVYQNSEDRVFDVIDAYYNRQSEFSNSNELEMSKSLLQDLSVDNREKIISQVESGEYQSDVQEDLNVAQNSGLRGTPTFNLFLDGKHQTKVVGPKGTFVFENTLNL